MEHPADPHHAQAIVQHHHDGQWSEALVAVQSGQRFDLVFMDCQMPVMDGYEATGRAIRQWEAEKPGLGQTTDSRLTANAMAGDRNAVLRQE